MASYQADRASSSVTNKTNTNEKMELQYLSIDRKAIHFGVKVNVGNDSTEERQIVAHEAPLPELAASFAKLSKVFCQVMELDEGYEDGLAVFRLSISYTKAGTRSVRLRATKQLECRRDYLHKIEAPMVQIDKPAEGESGEIQIEKKSVALVAKAIHEAERYANGERSQSLLNFDEAKAALQATADQGKDLLAGVN